MIETPLRPLTTRDRPEIEVGDVIAYAGARFAFVRIDESGRLIFHRVDGEGGFVIRKDWFAIFGYRYVSRVDGGPIEIEMKPS